MKLPTAPLSCQVVGIPQFIHRSIRTAFRAARARRYDYQRLVEVRLARERLLHNYRVFKDACAPSKVAPVLKSNAYGHGLVQVAKILSEAKPPLLIVESYYEALVLRNEGIRGPILVIGYTATENILRSRLPQVAFTLVDGAHLAEVARLLNRPQRFHLKVDTGMRRYGVPADTLDNVLQTIRSNRHMILEGACSHMAKTAERDDHVASAQIRTWNVAAERIRTRFPAIRYWHLASTGGSYWLPSMDANLARVGLGCFGFDYSPHRRLPLHPVLSVVSTVGSVRTVTAGEGIGYGHTFIAPRDMSVATVVSGYDTCVNARLSNRGHLLVRGVACPIVGRVCMNGTMIDVTEAPEVRVGDEVTIISAEPEDPNGVTNVAHQIGATRHEVLCGISPGLRRVIV